MTTEAPAAAPAGSPPAGASPADILYSTPSEPAPTPTEAAPAPEPAVGTDGGEAPSASPTPAEGAEGGSLATGSEVEGAEGEPEAPAEEAPPALTLDSYADLSLPEGLTLDEGLMGKFKDAALAANIAPKAAEGLLSLYNEALQAAQTSSTAAAQAQAQAWITQSNALPEMIGETGRITRQALGRAFDEYGTPELGRFLSETGVGNHPELVRYIARMAAALDEGRPSPSGSVGSLGSPNGRPVGPRSPGQILYNSGGPGSDPSLAQ